MLSEEEADREGLIGHNAHPTTTFRGSNAPVPTTQHAHQNYSGSNQYAVPNTRNNIRHSPSTTNGVLKFYYRFINPWIRLIVIFPVLYVYRVTLSISTWRGVTYQQQLATVNPRPPITRPLYDMQRHRTPFILPDYLFDAINPPPYPSSEYTGWVRFVEASPSFWVILAFVLMLSQRSWLRITEYVAIHIVLFIIQALLAVFTNYPAAGGVDPTCFIPQNPGPGMWMARAITDENCGDQMFSGHFSETLIAMIFVRRLIWDYVGWGFGRTERIEKERYEEIAEQAKEIKLSGATIDNTSHEEGNKDFFFYPIEVYSTPHWIQKHRTIVWIALSLLRLVMVIWVFLLAYAQLYTRQHYTADILVAAFLMVLLTMNRPLLVPLVRWLYRPAYWNYVREGVFSFVYLKEPWTLEQMNYERRVRDRKSVV